MTTLLAQLSDPHIREPGQLAYRRVDTASFLRSAVAAVARLKQAPDAVVITGDLTDFGREAEYRLLARLLEPLAMPVFLMPGNHDDSQMLRRGFPGHSYLGTGGFIQFSVAVGALQLLALDTTVPGRSEGRLCANRLAWLAAQLDAHRSRPVIVAMHHPPFRTLIGHMDAVGLLEGAQEFEALIKRHTNVERIICGHLHRPIHVRFGDTIASTAPSTAHQVCLDLAANASSAWVLEPPAFHVHALDQSQTVVTHLGFCGAFEGPFPFHDGGELID